MRANAPSWRRERVSPLATAHARDRTTELRVLRLGTQREHCPAQPRYAAHVEVDCSVTAEHPRTDLRSADDDVREAVAMDVSGARDRGTDRVPLVDALCEANGRGA